MNIIIKEIIENLSNSSGQQFFDQIVVNMARAIDLDYVFIAEIDKEHYTAKSIARCAKGQLIDNFEYSLKDTPCALVADDSICCYPIEVSKYFPKDELLIQMKIEGYIGTPLYNSKGEILGLTVALSKHAIQDVDEVRTLFKLFSGRIAVELERSKQEQQIQLLSTSFLNAAEAVLISDKDNHIIQVNPAFETVFGYSESEVLGKYPSVLTSDKNEQGMHQRIWQSLHDNNKWSGEIVNKKSDGCDIHLWVSIKVIRNKHDEIENYLAIYSDISELKRSQQKVKYLAYHDPLTTLYNKSFLNEILVIPKQRTLLLLDINHFNYINSAYGFENGDAILRSIANKLKIFGAEFELNIHVDEYGLLFDGIVDIKHIIQNIQKYFAEHPITISDVSLYISFTYGAAFGRSDLLRKSALALKKAKELGKNRYEIFQQDKEQKDYKQRKQFLEATNILHDAIESDNIIPYFQGIRDNKTGTITKYESLLRVYHKGEVLSPYPFLAPAKFSGMLPILTRMMIKKSFAIMANQEATFSINITEDDLSQFYLESYLMEKCQHYQINPNRVILEILEGVSATGQKNHINQLHALKECGFAIAIDDFGAEYSNFERVLAHDINYLKIDARYIKDIDSNEKSYEITKAIVYFAKNTGIPCIAEFVHNESVQRVVESLGIDYSQGYLFSEPFEFSNQSVKQDAEKNAFK